jgi:hypothetical protein
MGTNPPPRPQTTFSPDGFWWWDGTQWKAAVSPDRLWRWNGHTWEPNRQIGPPPRRGGGATTAVVVTVLGFFAVLVLVSILTVVVLLTMGNQLANVFSNVVAALGSNPSPSP